MSKSRFNKTKAAGEAVGLSICGKNYNQKARVIPQENRQMRRMRRKAKNKSKKRVEIRGLKGF